MSRLLTLGIAVGIITASISWFGNTELHQVSVFPNVVTMILPLVLLIGASWFATKSTTEDHGPSPTKGALIIAGLAGVIYSLLHVWMAYSKLEIHSAGVLAFGMIGGLVVFLIFGLIAGKFAALFVARGRNSSAV